MAISKTRRAIMPEAIEPGAKVFEETGIEYAKYLKEYIQNKF